MLDWIGSVINNGFGLGKQYLQNKGRVADAEVAYELAKLKARSELAATEARYELEVLKQTGDLDRMSMREAAKSIFDEFICMIPLSMLIYAIFDPAGAGKVFDELESLPTWFLVLIGLIYVRYLSYRGLLRFGLKLWGKKVFGLKVEAEEGRNENGRKAQTDKQGE